MTQNRLLHALLRRRSRATEESMRRLVGSQTFFTKMYKYNDCNRNYCSVASSCRPVSSRRSDGRGRGAANLIARSFSDLKDTSKLAVGEGFKVYMEKMFDGEGGLGGQQVAGDTDGRAHEYGGGRNEGVEMIGDMVKEYNSKLEEVQELQAMMDDDDNDDDDDDDGDDDGGGGGEGREMRRLIESEISSIEEKMKETAERIEESVVDYFLSEELGDEDDGATDKHHVILEVRPGTGGIEASYFGMELYNNYIKFCTKNRLSVKELKMDVNENGGVKEAVAEIKGRDVYDLFKYESGVHRVQRVPVNDVRIHTSAVTVVVLPMVSAREDIKVDMKDYKVDTMRSSGAGGQSVNTTDSAVRVTHIPTGITAAIQDERSQHKNRDKAMKVVQARLMDKVREEEESKIRGIRNLAIGKGGRSERIRSYNFKEGRITDHRCKVTVFDAEGILRDGRVCTAFTAELDKTKRLKGRELIEDMAE